MRKVDLQSFFMGVTSVKNMQIKSLSQNFSSERNFLHDYKRKQGELARDFLHRAEKKYSMRQIDFNHICMLYTTNFWEFIICICELL